MKKTFILAAAVVVALAGLAIAQTVPQVTTVNPTADLIQVIPNGTPSAGNKYAKVGTIANGNYAVIKNTTQFQAMSYVDYNWTFANGQAEFVFDPGSTVEYAYFTFAPSPSDGARACMFSTAAVTYAYPTANTGQTVNDAITAMVANTRYCYTYQASNLNWYRSN